MSADSVYNIDPPDTDFERGKLNTGWVRRDKNRTMPNRWLTYELITPSLRTVKECQLINELSENMPSTPPVYVTIMPKNEPHVSTMPTRMVTYEPITPSSGLVMSVI